MALHTLVKINRLNNLSDARYSAGMGVALLGINVEPGTPHYLDPQTFQEIAGWVSGPAYVAEFATETHADTVLNLAKNYPVEMLEVSTASLLPELKDQGYQLIYKHRVQAQETPQELSQMLDTLLGSVTYILLEHEDAEAKLNEEWLDLAGNYPVILGFGITADNAASLALDSRIQGIALHGEEEIRAGYKDYEMADVLEAIEKDDL